MHPLLAEFHERAKANPKTIALPELDDVRTLRAAARAKKKGLAIPVLVGEPDKALELALRHQIDISGIEIVDHMRSDDFDVFCQEYIRRRERKGKSVSDRIAAKMMSSPLNFASAMVLMDRVFGTVAGAANLTSNVVRSALFTIGPKEEGVTASSCTLMLQPDSAPEKIGENGAFIFADSGVIPQPTLDEVTHIGMSAIETARDLLKVEPRVSLLCYSTHGSAVHPAEIEKMIQAAKILKAKYPELVIDGELQFDAAVSPEICSFKAPESPIRGHTHVFIFPDLNSGNIAYKIAERLGGCQALGPLFQGLAKPMSDLSRGCTDADIVDVMVVTSIRTTT
ncbi:phosphate acetyltransferase [Candidatus Sumerlaeota bacterium]|nr:phosphate acetyltransferase [Candidatus Sumerlaeota bacterium]